MLQFDGIVEGYARVAPAAEAWTELDHWLAQAAGDVLDTINFLKDDAGEYLDARFDWATATAEEKDMRRIIHNHCSGLVRLTDEDLFCSQDAWFTYSAMTRVMKSVSLRISEPAFRAQTVTYSSYPGLLYSFDDFYTNDREIVVFETTNDVFDMSLYDSVTSDAAFTFLRAAIAIRMASTGPEFVEAFTQSNSGTYCNQYQIIDYKRIERCADGTIKALPGLLTIVEQMPTLFTSGDVTDTLVQQGYMPSYNIPFFQEQRDISGTTAMAVDDPSWDYYQCARAQVFARDAPQVETYSEFQHLMRQNDWQHDPFALGDAGNQVASRYDLRTSSSVVAFGALDSKTVNAELVHDVSMDYISSPTYDQQVPWRFEGNPLAFTHRGLYEGDWTFPWIESFGPIYK
eukprot:gnl/Ergobibamus_cyprinoides/716.p1 GENE.gnl/Ergobibamus_cyprinoides/716~~gnl/Ergobibamus_cyprinoides/716.p1  ORF type:complete len:453 (-),score=201.32 gnl/Ergobibamus_cyprinoides/716:195-1397(-)